MSLLGPIEIDTGIPWDAVASLAVGALTVAAATFVAVRQIGISRRQTEIQETLAGIEAAKLRAELFDRRFEIYEATARFGGAILIHGRYPEDDITRPFQLARDKSKFLFPPAVAEKMNEISDKAVDLMTAADMLADEHDFAERRRWAQAKAECMRYFSDLLNNLGEVFGDELRLGALRPGPSGPRGVR